MEKKEYIHPLVEAQLMESVIGIMKTSIEPGPDPGSLSAPKRVPSLSNDSVQVF